jgi:hypothetical protein
MRRIIWARTFVGVSLTLCARPLAAQWGIWTGDSLLAMGHLAAAESAYYAAVREHPRDPVVRAALGKYLAARGATRVGAVLLEEARFFGGDSATLARALIPMYLRLGDFPALDSLRPNVLTPAERRRARWLSDHPTEASLRDSIVVVTYRPLADGEGLGTVLLRLGKTELPAVVDPRVSGLVLPSAVRGDVRTFGADGGTTLAVAPSIRLGGMTFSNLPATIGDPDEKSRVGLDVLARYSPTFDPRSGLLTLRRVDRRSVPAPGTRVPALFDANGVRLLIGGRWHPSSAAMPALLLATRAWMWDGRRGDVVLLTP